MGSFVNYKDVCSGVHMKMNIPGLSRFHSYSWYGVYEDGEPWGEASDTVKRKLTGKFSGLLQTGTVGYPGFIQSTPASIL